MPSPPSAPRVTVCRACGVSPVGERVLDLGHSPLANNLCKLDEHHDEVFPLHLVRCPMCGLLQLSHVVDPAAMFSHYFYKPSQSDKTVSHFKTLAAAATARAEQDSTNMGRLVVDIGSNDGTLLSFFSQLGWCAVGVDPAENLASEANARGLRTLCSFFDGDSVDHILENYGRARIITACNVFAHTPNWQEFVYQAERLLALRGELVVEFPYGPTMLADGTFDLIYHEHASYPALGPLVRLVEPHGLHVRSADYLPDIHGGSVRVWIGRQPRSSSDHSRLAELSASEQTTYSAAAARAFAERAKETREHLVKVIRKYQRTGKRIVGYTAPAKAVTLIEFCGLGTDEITCIVDDNPLKQGHMLPGSHIPIVSAEEANITADNAVIVFAWNVVEDIMSRLPVGADVIVPMPTPKIEVVRR